MNSLEILTELEALNVKVEIYDDNLKIRARKGILSTRLMTEIKNRKPEILHLLRNSVKKVKKRLAECYEKREYYPVSSAQKRMYVLQQMDVNNIQYNMPQQYLFPGDIPGETLTAIFRRLIRRHDSLRTSFHLIDEVLVQRIREEVDFEIECLDAGPKTFDEDRERRGESCVPPSMHPDPVVGARRAVPGMIYRFTRPFDLVKAPLLRVGVVRSGESIRLLIDMHHIISDGMSHNILEKEFISLSKSGALPRLRVQYKDYSQWQNSAAQQESIARQKEYWLKEFSSRSPVLQLPYDFERPGIQSFAGASIHFLLNSKTTAALREIAMTYNATLFMVLLSSFYVLLAKMSGEEDIVIGCPAAGRRHDDFKNVIGMFVNTLALRNYPKTDKRFCDFLNEVRESTISAFDNQDYPFEELVEHISPERDAGRNPLFDVMFALQNLENDRGEAVNDSDEIEYGENVTANVDLSLVCVEKGKNIYCTFEYCTKLFGSETIERSIGYFKKAIDGIIENPEVKLPGITILSQPEKNRLLYDFNDTKREYPGSKVIHQLFEEQAGRNPDKTACRSHKKLTEIYPGINESTINQSRINQLKNFCFEKNRYIFRFKGNKALKALNVFWEKEENELILLKTNRLNYIAVNRPVLILLGYLNGKMNLYSIFKGIVEEEAEYVIYEIEKAAEENDFRPGPKERIRLDRSFKNFIILTDLLRKNNLIRFSGHRPGLQDLKTAAVDRKEIENDETINEAAPALLPVKKETSPVLLLGDRTGQASTGLLYIASFLRRKGIEAYCRWNDIDSTVPALKKNVVSLLERIRPKIVGISMKWFPHIARVLKTCRVVKEYDPAIKVVVGGNTASYYKDEIIKYECVDYVVVGDGEVPFLKICLGEENIPNCLYKKDGKLIERPITYVQNEKNCADIYLSHLEQIFATVKDPFLADYFYINTGKGCSMQCFYCAGCKDTQKRVFNREKPFLRGIAEVRKDIVEAQKYTSTFWFDFDLPLADTIDYYKKLWQGLDLSGYFGEFYFWKLPEKEFIDLVVKTFKYVFFNIDLCSLSEQHRLKLASLGLVKPQPTDEELFSFFDSCEKYDNVEVIINQIAGLPYFSYRDIEESNHTLDRLLGNYSTLIKIDWGRLHAQPGAPIITKYVEYDMECYGKTFADFLHYSELNLKEEAYPGLFDFHYPYIYFKDEALNSKITRFYIDTTKKIENKIAEKANESMVSLDVTFAELSEKSGKLAWLLREKGVKANSIVALMVNPSLEMVVGLLGILKAGGAYLPVDPAYPEGRIEYMLRDSNVDILLTTRDLAGKIEFNKTKVFLDDDVSFPGDIKKPGIINRPADLAYTIYTSGTTGHPKGVMVDHENVISLVINSNYIHFRDNDRLLLTGAFAFDISTFEIWGPLLNGISLHLVDKSIILYFEKLKQVIIENNISILHFTPQLLNQIVLYCPEIFSEIRVLLVGGDEVKPHYINEIRDKNKELKIVHMYGPTENTTFSSSFLVEDNYKERIPIGSPVSNSTVLIFSPDGNPCPVGVAGELYTGGAGISRGYLNKTQLTRQKFTGNPFNEGEILYRTGDLAKRMPDGNIHFLGRTDYQVKIRGYRIELGEIESRLLKKEEIKDSVVILREENSGEKTLCAYIVANEAMRRENPELRMDIASTGTPALVDYLSRYLPPYMIPSYFMEIDNIPLTPNGKIDRKSLPAPAIGARENYVAPGNEIEEKLVGIWSEVLDIDRNVIGIDSDFFRLGGHSLKATIVISKIHKMLNISIPLAEVFKNSTIRNLSKFIISSKQVSYKEIKRVEDREYYPLSSAQKRMYILQQMDANNIQYNMTMQFLIRSDLSFEQLQGIFRQLIFRHDSLRTSFHLVVEIPVQRIHKDLHFEIKNLNETRENRGESLLSTRETGRMIKHFIRPFHLSEAPILRAGLMRTGQGNLLLIDMHHIVSDGISHNILEKEFISLSEGNELPGLRLQYKDYSEWQNSREQQEIISKQAEYWLTEFTGPLPILHLPYDFERPAVQSFAGANINFWLSSEETEGLNEISIMHQTTLFMVLLSSLNILLSKMSGEEDIIVGSPNAGRRHDDFKNIIGMFVNTLALRNYPKGEKRFIDFLHEVKEKTLSGFENQDYQFEELVENISTARETGRNPVFDVMFGVQNLEYYEGEEISDSENIGHEKGLTSKFDLTFVCTEVGNKIYCTFEYCTKLFKAETVARFAGYFRKVIKGVIENPQVKLSGIDILSESERYRLLNDFNDTEKEYPESKIIHRLFREQVESAPGHTAVVFEYRVLTYEELNHRANRLAGLLRGYGVEPGKTVGIMGKASLEMIIGILGILKAGGAYLPIDPGYPRERVTFILDDIRVKLVLTTGESSIHSLKNTYRGVNLNIDDLVLHSGDKGNPQILNTPADLAYIMYTSGSTGKPKGVMVDHANVVRLAKGAGYIEFSEGDRLLLTGNFMFDITTFEMMWPLLNGLTLCLIKTEDILGIKKLKESVIRNGISVLHLIPQLFNQVSAKVPGMFGYLKYFLVGGDNVTPKYIDEIRSRYPRLTIVHMYGPTENTTFSTSFKIEHSYGQRIPIGSPVSHSTVFILSPDGNLCPVGIAGELCTGGDGVARGYLNNVDLTHEKFVDNPFDQGERLYRTGDLAKWLPGGNIEFLGRIDNQVKIRGSRIELGEIEEVLLQYGGIAECIVNCSDINNEKQLVAYYKKKDKMTLWPSLAEYFVYDELIYNSMVNDEARNIKYRNAINKVIKDKVVLEVGPGSEAILARMCIEAGAKKVYAVEILEDAYLKAVEKVKSLGLEDKIVLIHGDILEVELHEKIDCCISEIVGTIGGSEGAAKIMNSVRAMLPYPENMIPYKSITNIAAITLPEPEFKYGFDEVGAYYTGKIFEERRRKFDLRLCLQSFPRENIISNPGIFEVLDFTKENPLEDEHEIYLEINRHSVCNGFVIWLTLFCDEEEVIDTLEKKYIWLPIYLPVFFEGERVGKGDFIRAKIIRKLSENNLNPDFSVKGILFKKNENEEKEFVYHLPHSVSGFRGNDFYKRVFPGGEIRITKNISSMDIRGYLDDKLPAYMIPSYFIELEEIPLTHNGKVDRKSLPEPEVGVGDNYRAPGNEIEEKLAAIWAEVLGIDKKVIGIDSDFFGLGGHSLKATAVISKIHKIFNVTIPLVEIFKNSTIKNLSGTIMMSEQVSFKEIKSVEQREYYPVSSAQKRMYVLQHMDPNNTHYNMPMQFKIPGDLVNEKLAGIFRQLIRRHDSLRTSFHVIDEMPVQRIRQEVDFEIEYLEAGLASGGQERRGEPEPCAPQSMRPNPEVGARRAVPGMIHRFTRPFDLSKPPLLRAGLIHTGEGSLLFIDMHHIVTDGISHNLMGKEFHLLREGKELQGLKLQYKDYAEWQNSSRQQKIISKQGEYWLREFAGRLPILNLPYDFKRPTIQSFAGANVNFWLNSELTGGLREIGKNYQATLSMLLLSSFCILLSKMSGEEDIIVGCAAAGRNHADFKNIIGMFVNTLALRNYPKGDKGFIDFLKEVKVKTLSAFENQDYPFENLIENISFEKDAGRNPVFDVMFVLQNLVDYEGEEICYSDDIEYGRANTSKFDLSLICTEVDKKIYCTFEYCTKLFKGETIERLARCFRGMIKSIIEYPALKLSGIDALSEPERYRLLHDFNDTKTGYPESKVVQQLFEDQVECIPGNGAVVFEDRSLTYKELNSRANRLARLLRNKGVKPGTLVGVMVNRSLEMIIGILSILKAGGGYLPIDPGYPRERVRYILQDSDSILLTAKRDVNDKSTFDKTTIYIDDERQYNREDAANLALINHSSDLIYVIYTSGTTGKPKGVLVKNKGIVNMIFYHKKIFNENHRSRISQVASPGFDAMAFETWPCLVNGGNLILFEGAVVGDPGIMREWLIERCITISFQPTIMAEYLLEKEWPAVKTALRVLRTAGDKLTKYPRHCFPFRFYNLYGPTEGTIWTTWTEVETGTAGDETPVIGKPTGNNSVYILSAHLTLQPVGVAGELCICGHGLSAGYLNHPELTAEKFTVHPFDKRERLYRTGDLARWLPCGNIEFLGRIDHQVKIRGFRIELGEIENHLLKIDGIKEAVVMAREEKPGEKYLCAYIVADETGDGKEIDITGIREILAENLPAYMIPSYFVPLEKIPLTANGKIDEKLLPLPGIVFGENYAAPRNEVEEKLCKVWSEVLGLERMSINANFFEVGGDSIKAIQISARLAKYKLKLHLPYLFKYPYISKLSKHITAVETEIDQGIVTGEIPLTPIQEWFFAGEETGRHHFNQSVMLYRQKGFDERILHAVFSELTGHHDMFRAVYRQEGGKIVQVNRGLDGKFHDLYSHDFRDEPGIKNVIEKKARELQESINLEKGPLLKIALFKTGSGDHLLIVIHHLIVDGVSWRIILEDISAGYEQALQGEAIHFPAKTSSFKSWSEEQIRYASSPALLKELSYWLRAEESAVGLIPGGERPRKSQLTVKNRQVVFMSLDKESTGRLLKETGRTYNTEINDLLLTALALSIKDWAGIAEVAVGLEGHGREDIGKDIDVGRTVGWFTTQYPVLLKIKKSGDLSYTIRDIKETLRKVPKKGIGYGVLRYLTPQEKKNNTRFMGFSGICFNYLGEFGGETTGKKVFAVSGMPQGDSISPNREFDYRLDLNGMTADGRFRLGFGYNKNEYKEETIKTLCSIYRRYLKEIIDHCVSKEQVKKTPADYGCKSISLEKLDKIEQHVRRVDDTFEIQDIYSLGPMQRGMLFKSLIDPFANNYLVQKIIFLEGIVDIKILEESFNRVISKYDVLRTLFVSEGLPEPLQVVLKERSLHIKVSDICGLSPLDRENYIKDFIEKDRKKPFDLSRHHLLRISLVKMTTDSFCLTWDFHHILMDAWCFPLIYNDLVRVYCALKNGTDFEIGTVTPYREYIEWFKNRSLETGIEYWRDYLKGYEVKTVLPQVSDPPGESTYDLRTTAFNLDEDISAGLSKIAAHNDVTLNVLLQTAWGLLLHRYNDVHDAVFGAVVSGRPAGLAGVEDLVGLFINTIPVRIKAGKNDRFIDLLKRAHENFIGSGSHEYVPLADIQNLSKFKNCLIDHIISFTNFPVNQELQRSGSDVSPGFRIKNLDTFEPPNYDLIIFIQPAKKLSCEFFYNAHRYGDDTMAGIIEGFKNILRQIVAEPGQELSGIHLPHRLVEVKSNITEEGDYEF